MTVVGGFAERAAATRCLLAFGVLVAALSSTACGGDDNPSTASGGGAGAAGGAGGTAGSGGRGGPTQVLVPRVFFVSEDGDLYQAPLDGRSSAIQISKAPQLLPDGRRAGRVSHYAVSPDGQYVAYQGTFDEVPSGPGPELHVVPVEGGPSTRLDRDLGFRGPPFAWSPAGDRLAYVSQVGITSEFVLSTLDATRTIVDAVGDSVTSFGWGPASDQLTFSRSAGPDQPDPGIFVVSPDAISPVRLGAPGLWFWSPDGERLAYQADVDNDGALELFSVLPDGTDHRKASADLGARDAAWAPDGKRIGYVSWQEEVGKPPPPELYTVSADGTDNRRINRTLAVPPQGDVGGAGSAQWSPTGDRIAYLATERDPGRADLYVASAEGTDHVRLNGTLQTISRVRWSPAGDRIAYFGQTPPNDFIRLYTSAASGEEDAPLRVSPSDGPPFEGGLGAIMSFSWSPDGTQIAYVLFGPPAMLFVNRATGGEERRLSQADEAVDSARPTWSQDGSRLLYLVLDVATERAELRSVSSDGSDNIQIWDGVDEYSLFP